MSPVHARKRCCCASAAAVLGGRALLTAGLPVSRQKPSSSGRGVVLAVVATFAVCLVVALSAPQRQQELPQSATAGERARAGCCFPGAAWARQRAAPLTCPCVLTAHCFGLPNPKSNTHTLTLNSLRTVCPPILFCCPSRRTDGHGAAGAGSSSRRACRCRTRCAYQARISQKSST